MFYQYLHNRSTFLLQIWAANLVQPCWLPMKSRKRCLHDAVWTRLCHTCQTCSWFHKHKPSWCSHCWLPMKSRKKMSSWCNTNRHLCHIHQNGSWFHKHRPPYTKGSAHSHVFMTFNFFLNKTKNKITVWLLNYCKSQFHFSLQGHFVFNKLDHKSTENYCKSNRATGLSSHEYCNYCPLL